MGKMWRVGTFSEVTPVKDQTSASEATFWRWAVEGEDELTLDE